MGSKSIEVDRVGPSFKYEIDEKFNPRWIILMAVAPRLVEAGGHPNIEFITYAALEEIKGEVGYFKVRVTPRIDLLMPILKDRRMGKL